MADTPLLAPHGGASENPALPYFKLLLSSNPLSCLQRSVYWSHTEVSIDKPLSSLPPPDIGPVSMKYQPRDLFRSLHISLTVCLPVLPRRCLLRGDAWSSPESILHPSSYKPRRVSSNLPQQTPARQWWGRRGQGRTVSLLCFAEDSLKARSYVWKLLT